MTHSTASESCPQLVLDWIAWYPEGDLPEDVRGAIERHAAECAACRREIAELSDGAAQDVAAPPEEVDRVFARTLDKIASRPRPPAPPPARRRLWMVRPRFAVAAGLAVAVLSGVAGGLATRQLAPEPSYELVTLPVARAGPGVYLDVVFRADASFAEIARAMHAIGASVESGPSPSGVVLLHLARGADPAAVARRLESGDLRVAEFAQPAP
jgi:hypothetical protein